MDPNPCVRKKVKRARSNTPRKAPLPLRASRPVASSAALRLDIACTEAELRAALEHPTDASAPLLIPIEDWSASSKDLFDALVVYPLYDIPLQGQRPARRFALAALRRVEDITAWSNHQRTEQGDEVHDALVASQLRYGTKRLSLRARSTLNARLRASWAGVSLYANTPADFVDAAPDSADASAPEAGDPSPDGQSSSFLV